MEILSCVGFRFLSVLLTFLLAYSILSELFDWLTLDCLASFRQAKRSYCSFAITFSSFFQFFSIVDEIVKKILDLLILEEFYDLIDIKRHG